MTARPDATDRWLQQGPCTATSDADDLLRDLPSDTSGLVSVCQGLLVHEHLAGLYHVELDEHRRAAVHLRRALDIIAEINRVHPAPLAEWREPQERVAANCRQFTVLLVALLRASGTPARARCGFSDYFGTGRWEDHWVAEVWDDTVGSWRLVDAQVDDLQRELLGIDLDPLDVPRDRFRVAGEAWRRCRSGLDDAGRHGLSATGEFGMWWVGANLMRDAWALEGIEVLPWDSWGAMPGPSEAIDDRLLDEFDLLADCTVTPDAPHTGSTRQRVIAEPSFALGDSVHNDVLDRDEAVPL